MYIYLCAEAALMAAQACLVFGVLVQTTAL